KFVVVAKFEADGPVRTEVTSDAGGEFEFAFGFVEVVFPFGGVSEVNGPFPIAEALADDDFLLEFSFAAGKAWFEIKVQADGVIGWIEDHVTILDGNAFEFEFGYIAGRSGGDVAIAFVFGVEIKA